ncbi:sulfur carrier protein ThiS [Marinospirillum insulare]|uniref:Sulfur carrier protein ThiS n=1 Tax=Marinospirillum insulare TaxID=217169 RepID=A0ABQ5ZXL6_9GAMM|nr:sulfur carrier protein ThiS [Marinospirillum insulare]GLR64899.1 sulfur carrier protein ThiS [Marinospirillum insulare]
MQIRLNGQAYALAESASIVDLLEQLDLTGKRLAVEINEAIIPKSRHAETFLQANDQVEIVHAIGGG